MRTSQFIDRYIPANTIVYGELLMAKIIVELGTRDHYVYFLLADLDDGRKIVKVGTSTNIERRVFLIKNRVPYKIDRIIGQVCGDEELESHLHNAFHKFKYAKEWFHFEPVKDYIYELLENYGVNPDESFKVRDENFGKIQQRINQQCNN